MPNEPTATSAAPAAAPAPAPATPGTLIPAKKQVQAMTVKTSFKGTTAAATPLEKAKEYLKDIPVLHARLTAVVSALESTLASARKAAADLEKTGADIKANVARWEEEQNHAGPGRSPAVHTPAPGSATVDANAAVALPRGADPGVGAPPAPPAGGTPGAT